MSRIEALTPATAKGGAQEMLSDLVARHGQVSAMVATMAHSPAVLGGYLQLSKAMKRAKLSRRVSELVSIAVQARQGCQLCLEAHIAAANAFGVTDDEVADALEGTSPDPAVAAMIATGLAIYSNPTAITDEQVDELRAHGYTDREIVDAVGIVALNVLTGASNLIAGLGPDRTDAASVSRASTALTRVEALTTGVQVDGATGSARNNRVQRSDSRSA